MDDRTFLSHLAAKLELVRSKGLATQLELEAKTGVDQAVISRVFHRKRRRVTEKLRRLDRYADMLIGHAELSASVSDAAMEFLAFGSEDELVATIQLGTRLVSQGRLSR